MERQLLYIELFKKNIPAKFDNAYKKHARQVTKRNKKRKREESVSDGQESKKPKTMVRNYFVAVQITNKQVNELHFESYVNWLCFL